MECKHHIPSDVSMPPEVGLAQRPGMEEKMPSLLHAGGRSRVLLGVRSHVLGLQL